MNEDMKVLILGLGKSGFAAAMLAKSEKAEVSVLDTGSDDEALIDRAEQLRINGIEVHLGWTEKTWNEDDLQLAIISPGIPKNSVLGNLAESLSCEIISELEFGFRYTKCPVLAVTGTNGKTTTVELTTHCLSGAGKQVLAAGNIGLPLSKACLQSHELDYIVVEASSFQLEHVARFAPLAASCLNITSDHMDRYESQTEYLQTKLAIFDQLQDSGKAIIRQDLWVQEALRKYPLFATGPPVIFTSDTDNKEAEYFLDAEGFLSHRDEEVLERLMHRDEMKLIGRHNVENALVAIALCRQTGLSFETITEQVKCFEPSPHRLELVLVHQEVTYINDSKSTNPDAMIQAIRTTKEMLRDKGELLLIAGGKDKDMNFDSVLSELNENIKEVFLIGELTKQLNESWKSIVPCRPMDSLDAVVDAVINSASAGDIVLLSPGAASQDMFINYADRGSQFCQSLKRRLQQ